MTTPTLKPLSLRSRTLHDPLLWWMLGISAALRLLMSALIGPGFDEAYYHAFSLHLSAGYFDHPPLVAITAGLGRWLTGWQHPLTLRFGAVLWWTVALLGLYRLALHLYGRRAARLAVFLPHTMPYFLVGAGAFVIPDNALAAAWVWALVVAHEIRDERIKRLHGFLLLGALTGIALLAKYHAVLLPAALVIASLYDRKLRAWWRDPRLYLAVPVALLVFLPCILWNAQNEWISFAEQFGKGSSGGLRLRFDLLGQAVGGQVGYLTPWMAIALWIASLKRPPQRRAEDRWLLAFWLLPVGLFTLLGLTRGILPHWTMPGYLSALVLAAGWFARNRGAGGDDPLETRVDNAEDLFVTQKQASWLGAAFGVLLVLIAGLILHAHTDLIPLPDKGDPTLDPAGWERAVNTLEQQGDLTEDDVFFTHKWFTGGEILWA
ncbi:hypothetical protein GF324_05785, partial [bacterium]|nr:hypothetical protein [bacterium]